MNARYSKSGKIETSTLIGILLIIVLTVLYLANWKSKLDETPPQKKAMNPQQGDMSTHGGTPTIRRAFSPVEDDPNTTNDESNDQPQGYFGRKTLQVTNLNSGNSYPLDADIEGRELHRLYFPKGGWIDFIGCELDDDFHGTCTDEEGREWEFNGESYSTPSLDLDDDNDESESIDEGSEDEE